MATQTVTASKNGQQIEYQAYDGGDGWLYFHDSKIYRVAKNNINYVQQGDNYNQSQKWTNVTYIQVVSVSEGATGGGAISPNANLENAVQWMINIANDNSHGYDQENRDGPDYDCSSLIWHALKQAGFNVGNSAFSTENEASVLTGAGFKQVQINPSQMQRGDVLLKVGHTECYVGNQMMVGAHSNEFGGIKGGRTGDQTGHEINVQASGWTQWDSAWRFESTGWLTGVASVYGIGDGLLGSQTASGEIVTETSMGVAMKTVALGTKITIKYGDKEVTGKVNDRGPYVAGRDIDLQPAMARGLGFEDGVHTVQYKLG